MTSSAYYLWYGDERTGMDRKTKYTVQILCKIINRHIEKKYNTNAL